MSEPTPKQVGSSSSHPYSAAASHTDAKTTGPEYLPQDSALSLSSPHDLAQSADGDTDADGYDDANVDGGFDDNDSAFGGSLIGCDTDTLASYVTDYRYENGRRYHAYADGAYWVRARLTPLQL
jgi:hypothetical protein